jgi:drug/metabolite transporter (DMT)-like permease
MSKPLDRFSILLMSALATAWGGNQVAAKFALADFGPMTQCALRSGIGAVLVGLYAARARPQVFRGDGTLFIAALVGVAAGIVLLSWPRTAALQVA